MCHIFGLPGYTNTIKLSFSVNLVKTLLLLLNMLLSFKVSFKDKSPIFVTSFASIKLFTPEF
jgi:hypothetical protein